MHTVRVSPPLAAAASYEIRTAAGGLGHLVEWVDEVARADRYAVIADSSVAPLYGRPVCDSLAALAPAELFSFAAGEASKTRETWTALGDAMLRAGFGRDACVIALGGGVTGDIAGFVAATYMRGIPWVQLPTSLLAMIDASIGGKTGVDVPGGKNLVGAFHQPRLVLVDPDVLTTLPIRELRHGLAEAVKHGAIADAAYHDWIHASANALCASDPTALERLIHRSIQIKAEVVSEDPFEQGRRASLNFGHTVAHAVERLTRFAVPHGQAVSMGMVAEARIGEEAGITERGSAQRLAATLSALGLPIAIPAGLQAEDLLDAALGDKKARSGRIRWSLIERIGRAATGASDAWTHEIPHSLLAHVIGEMATLPDTVL